MTEYLRVGKVVAASGLKGEILVRHYLGKKSSFPGLKTIFIEERKDSFLPWFIESTRLKSAEEVYLKLETVDTRESALKLTQKDIWITAVDFKNLAAKSSPINLLGFTLVENGNPLGQVVEVIEQPHQILCRLLIQEKEVLIPLNEETLLKINYRAKRIDISLPSGLLDIYLK